MSLRRGCSGRVPLSPAEDRQARGVFAIQEATAVTGDRRAARTGLRELARGIAAWY
ncbi:MAG: hypothetical protein JRN62_10245 [Nitrososphaerota archaeon]|nr:hypothetical protein [Nitrososphaerota archaeon]